MTARANRKLYVDESAEQRRRNGICPICLHFVGKSKLLVVRSLWMCGDCGHREIDAWNESVNGASFTRMEG